jgi:hypothetical protein
MIRGVVSATRPVYYLNRLSRTGWAVLLFASIRCLWGQSPPVSPRGPWHSSEEQRIVTEARHFLPPLVRIDPERVYSLTELIDLAEANNPETRVAWEDAVAQAGALGVARRNRLGQAEAHIRQPATELVNSATQSYSAALESCNYGVRNLLDVTNAQKVLAQARSTDVLPQTQVLADLTFRTGDAIQANTRKTHS